MIEPEVEFTPFRREEQVVVMSDVAHAPQMGVSDYVDVTFTPVSVAATFRRETTVGREGGWRLWTVAVTGPDTSDTQRMRVLQLSATEVGRGMAPAWVDSFVSDNAPKEDR